MKLEEVIEHKQMVGRLTDKLSAEMGVGIHISKKKTFLQSLLDHIEENGCTPVQIFTGSTQTWKRSTHNKEDVDATRQTIIANNMQFFIHSIYLINIGRTPEEIVPAHQYIKHEFELGKSLGCRGIVIHVGKHLKQSVLTGINNMKKNIELFYPHIDPSCPLLLETPAGQGTECLTNIEDFINFYKTLNPTLVKICVDTCHVFQCNYCPLDYLHRIYETLPGSLVLVHFNDSMCCKGECRDRHAYPGRGHIGLEKMNQIRVFCYTRRIPIVVE